MGCDGKRRPLEASLHRLDLRADARGSELPAGERIKTYIATGGGQDFVRVYSDRVYGIPPEQVVGTAGQVRHTPITPTASRS